MTLSTGIRNLQQQYADGPSVFESMLATVPAPCWKWRPADTEWSVHEIVVHCADSETYAAIRLRLLLAEESPLIVGYDQDHWARTFQYHDQPLQPALDAIRVARALTVPLVNALTREQLDVVGQHTESGRYGVSDWLESYGRHLHVHATQVQANVEVWTLAEHAASVQG